jgi:hypothetical protein
MKFKFFSILAAIATTTLGLRFAVQKSAIAVPGICYGASNNQKENCDI